MAVLKAAKLVGRNATHRASKHILGGPGLIARVGKRFRRAKYRQLREADKAEYVRNWIIERNTRKQLLPRTRAATAALVTSEKPLAQFKNVGSGKGKKHLVMKKRTLRRNKRHTLRNVAIGAGAVGAAYGGYRLYKRQKGR